MPPSSSRYCSLLPIPILIAATSIARVWNTFSLTLTSTFNFPSHRHDVVSRINHNLAYFRLIYLLQFLLILFLSLIPHPFLLLIFFPFLLAWFFYFFIRPRPFVVFGFELDNSFILAALWLLTAFSMLLSGLWFNLLLSFLVGFGVVALHATFRKTDDLYMDEQHLFPQHPHYSAACV
ncbi:Prenylated rab acceptor PRA1 [Senna tora]|uniref:PRA1 family protein n=1 Tax=Senna tora TaxID=362788 RepID=A0A834TES3_9FABA|nr:Prenylated rab acceptor PRA1 [Senna tora]